LREKPADAGFRASSIERVLALTSTPANPFVALREVEAPIARGATRAKHSMRFSRAASAATPCCTSTECAPHSAESGP
jgi:hypothetical protein